MKGRPMFNPFSTLTSKIYGGIAIFALTFACVQTVRIEGLWFIDGYVEKLANEKSAHIATKLDYADAQKKSAEINRSKVAQIERDYATIAEKSEIEYEKRIADNRAALDRWVRSQATKRDTSSAGASPAATMSAEPLQGTETAIVPISDLEIVADAYAQLDALRAWALYVGKVE